MANGCTGNKIVGIPTRAVSWSMLGGCPLARLCIGIILVTGVAGFSASAVATELAHNFTFTLYHGQRELSTSSLELAGLRGRPVVLNFWAPFCPPCRAEMPDIQRFHQKFNDRVWTIGLDVGRFTDLGGREETRELLGELGITYVTGFTEDENVMQAYGIRGIPTTVFIDAEGEVFLKWQGVVDQDALTNMTTKMLNR